MQLKSVFFFSILLLLSGCYRVGRMPITTQSGPHYEDTKSAILVPSGSQTEILTVNNENINRDLLDSLANLTLMPFLMYLEPQVSVRPGRNILGLRALEKTEEYYGRTTITTTRWRDYTLEVDVKEGQRYFFTADLNSGASIMPDSVGNSRVGKVASR